MSERVETRQIIEALRCIADGNECASGCPYGWAVITPEEIAERPWLDEWAFCDSDRVYQDAAARLEELETENARLRAEVPKEEKHEEE